MKKSIRTALAVVLAIYSIASAHALQIDLEDISLSTPPAISYGPGGVYYNGKPTTPLNKGDVVDGSFLSGGASFFNRYGSDATYDYEYWGGFGYSTTTDLTTGGFANQFSAYTAGNPDGSPLDGSNTYAVGYVDSFNEFYPTITLPVGMTVPHSVLVANTTWSWDYIDSLADKEDFYLKLTIFGLTGDDQPTGLPVEFFLADFRTQASPGLLGDWELIDLTPLGNNAAKVQFVVESSDMWTPTYVAVDNLTVSASTVPEPGAFALLAGSAAILSLRRRTFNRA